MNETFSSSNQRGPSFLDRRAAEIPGRPGRNSPPRIPAVRPAWLKSWHGNPAVTTSTLPIALQCPEHRVRGVNIWKSRLENSAQPQGRSRTAELDSCPRLMEPKLDATDSGVNSPATRSLFFIERPVRSPPCGNTTAAQHSMSKRTDRPDTFAWLCALQAGRLMRSNQPTADDLARRVGFSAALLSSRSATRPAANPEAHPDGRGRA